MYDLAIIGGGPAGYSAAFEAVGLQMKVILFEKEQMGGTCLNRGCVPTKYLSHVGKIFNEMTGPSPDGISCSGAELDFSKTSVRMNEIVSKLRGDLEMMLQYGQVSVVRGEASVNSKRQIMCDGQIYEAKNILIATGSKAGEPLVPGAISSDELLRSDTIPEKLHVLGGGVVAVEFAQIFRMLGSEVTMSIRANRILRKWDEEIASALARSMAGIGICIQKNCDFKNLSIDEGSVVLSAAGRVPVLPSVEGNLYDIGEGGGIIADANGRTRTQGIYAAGDVLEGSLQLAHIGMEQGKRAVRHMAGLENSKEPSVVSCIYGEQEAVSVGLTEAAAEAKGLEAVTVKMNMASNARALILDQQDGFVKIIAEKRSGKILGAQLLCERGGDMAAELALGIDRGLTVKEMLETVRPHPSFCEAVTDALKGIEGQLGIRPAQAASQEPEKNRKGGKLRFWK